MVTIFEDRGDFTTMVFVVGDRDAFLGESRGGDGAVSEIGVCLFNLANNAAADGLSFGLGCSISLIIEAKTGSL